MNIQGKAEFDSSVETVWDALHDPEVLKKAIPGCKELLLNENGEYDVVMKLGVAAVKGEYEGKVKVEDIDVPRYYILHASGSGSPGHVTVKMDCEFYETEKGCRMEYDCNAEVGGMIAGVGSRVLGGIAKFMAGNFFKDIKKQIKVMN